MIEKLDLDNGYATVDWLPTQHGKRCGAKEIQTTVNQLVDAVNVLQSQVAILQEHAHPTATTESADPYAEQRKWVGKLCKVYDDNDLVQHYAILDEICDDSVYCYGTWVGNYQHCELVKPDDDIIYKGGDND